MPAELMIFVVAAASVATFVGRKISSLVQRIVDRVSGYVRHRRKWRAFVREVDRELAKAPRRDCTVDPCDRCQSLTPYKLTTLPMLAEPAISGAYLSVPPAGRSVSPEELHRLTQDCAYEIWESQGRPRGRDAEHWAAAEKIARERLGL